MKKLLISLTMAMTLTTSAAPAMAQSRKPSVPFACAWKPVPKAIRTELGIKGWARICYGDTTYIVTRNGEVISS